MRNAVSEPKIFSMENPGVKIIGLYLGDIKGFFGSKVRVLLRWNDGKEDEIPKEIQIELTLDEIKDKLSQIADFSKLSKKEWDYLFLRAIKDQSGELSRFLIDHISTNNSIININFLSKNPVFLDSFFLIFKDDKFYEKVFENFYYKQQLDRNIVLFLFKRKRDRYRNPVLDEIIKKLSIGK